MYRLGVIYRHLAFTGEAGELLEDALATRRRILGKAHPDIARTLHALASLRLVEGRCRAAELRGREALALDRRHFGENHPAVAEDLDILGQIARAQGDLARAAALHRRATAMDRRTGNAASRDGRLHLNSLALVLRERGDHRAAAAILKDLAGMGRERHRQWLKLFGDREVVIDLWPARLGGRVVEAGGGPVSQGLVVLHRQEESGGEENVLTTGSEDDGTFYFPRVPPGRYRVSVRRTATRPSSGPWISPREPWWTLVAGRAVLENLPAGTWTVRIEAGDGRSWSAVATTNAAAAVLRVE